MRIEQSRDKRRHSGGRQESSKGRQESSKGRQESSSRKYDYDAYSNYESRGQTHATPSEYDRTEGRQTVFTEYTEYTGRTPYTEYSENESGKRTPFSENATEYTYGTYDDRNPGTLGIGRNQYCTQLNGVFGVDESDSYEDSRYTSYSHSQSYSETDSNPDQICDANVNTNCMTTLFNRNTNADPNVPGTIHCDKIAEEEVEVKMTLPLPLQYMDHFVSSKNNFNTYLDTFAKKCDNSPDEQIFPEVYKSLFQAPTDGSDSSSSEEEEDRQDHNDDFRPRDRKNPPQTAVDNHKEQGQGLASPPSHIVISDEASAVSSAGSLGFPGERESSNFFTRRQKDEPKKIIADYTVKSPKSHGLDRIMGKQVASPKNRFAKDEVASPRNRFFQEEIASPKNRFAKEEVASPKNRSARDEVASPRNRYSKEEVASPRNRASKEELASPRNRSARDEVASPRNRFSKEEVASPKNRSAKGDVASPKNRFAKDEVASPRNRYLKDEVASPKNRSAKDEVASPKSRFAKEEVASPKNRFAKDEVTSPKNRYLNEVNSKAFFGQNEEPVKDNRSKQRGIDQTPSYTSFDEEKRSQRHAQVNSQKNNNLGAGKNSQWLKGEKELLDLVNEDSPTFDQRAAPVEAVKTSAFKNSAGSIPYAVSFGAAPEAYSDLTSEFGDFGNRGNIQAPSQPSASTSKQHDPHNDTAGDELMQSLRLSPPKTREHVDEGDELMGPQNATPPKRATSEFGDFGNRGKNQAPSQPSASTSKQHDPHNDTAGDELMQSLRLSPPKTREHVDEGDELMGPQNATPPKSATMLDRSQPEEGELMKRSSRPKKAENLETIEAALMGPRKINSSLYESRNREGKDSVITGDELMKSQPAKAPSVSPSDVPEGDELMLSPSTPKRLKEFDILGDELMGSAEGKPQITSDSTHSDGDELMGRLSPKSKETPGKAPKVRQDDTAHSLKEEPVKAPLSLYPDSFSDYCKDLAEGDKPKSVSTKLPSTPIPVSDLESQISNLESQISKLEQESQISKLQQKDTISKFHKPLKSHDYTDIPLVTAPTAMTMETPFTFDTPLVSSPTFTAMDAFDPELKSKRFVSTSVALPIHSNGKDAVVSFRIIFVEGTKKCLTDILIIIIAWVRHFSNGRFERRKNGGMAIGLFLPTLDDSDVIQEHAVQGRPAFYHLPSLSSDEPGMFVESFVPDVETTTDSNGRLSVYDVCLPSRKRSFWPNLFQKKVEIPTPIWETEKTWSDKCDQYEEFGFWNK